VPQDPWFGYPAGPRGDHEGLAPYVEQRTPDEARRPAEANQDQGGERQRQVAELVQQPTRGGQVVGIQSSRAKGWQHPQLVGEHPHQHHGEPVAREGEQND